LNGGANKKDATNDKTKQHRFKDIENY